MLRKVAIEADDVARGLISTQFDYLDWFRGTLISPLFFYVLLALGVALLFLRQRRLQAKIREDEAMHAQRIGDFADVGADWFWEMFSNLRLKALPNRDISINIGHEIFFNDGMPYKEFVFLDSDERASRVRWPVDSLLEQRAFSDYESETTEGEKRVTAVSGKPLFDVQGDFTGFRGIGRDFSESKKIEWELESVYHELIQGQTHSRERAEEALRDSEQFLRISIDAMSPNIAILDRNGTSRAANKAWRDLSGSLPDGGVGYHYLLAFSH